MKTRFCPSPTGMMHLGNARTALFSALLATSQSGPFLLRIEDTDQTRSDERFTDALKEDLLWLGLKWQEGPDVGGNEGPYWQSQRQAIYDQYYLKLEASERAYPCFCSEQELSISRKVQIASGKPPRYSGTCRQLTADEIEAKQAEGKAATLRFKIPKGKTIIFEDLVRGKQRFLSDDIGDFIIRRTDGTPPFMYCNAIDDALMGVTHVLRGEDHLTNTPRQLMILEAIDLPLPEYGHITLIVGDDGSPLSKRHGAKSIAELRDDGFLSMAVVNYLARLGHYYADNSLMDFNELAVQFGMEHLGASPARYDPKQLEYWQKEVMTTQSPTALLAIVQDAFDGLVPSEKQIPFLTCIIPNCVFPNDAINWAKIIFAKEMNYSDDAISEIKAAGDDYFQAALAAIDQFADDYKEVMKSISETLSIKGKSLFLPMRMALTANAKGPELKVLFAVLGKETLKQRIQQVINLS